MQKKSATLKVHDIYIFCLNPNCPKPQQRCLDSHSLRLHPSECSKYFYPTESILEHDWTTMPDYPNDGLGIAVKKKLTKNSSFGYLHCLITAFKEKILKIIDSFYNTLQQINSASYLQNKFTEIYSLEHIKQALIMKSDASYINNAINHSLAPQKYQDLLLFNSKLDQIGESLDNVCASVNKTLRDVVAKTSENEYLKKTLPENYDKKIIYGLVKSKFIGSSKITCENGIVTFPKMSNIASFLPWVYCEKPFSNGTHLIKIHALKFPLVSNCGLSVLEEHDIDTYPYHYFKSLYNHEGRGFELVEGSQMEHIIGETAIIILKLDLGANSTAEIYDQQRRSKYQCQLKQNRSYRVAIYGCGWATQVMELS